MPLLGNHVVVEQGSQTRGPHVAREGVLCDPRCFLRIFKKIHILRFLVCSRVFKNCHQFISGMTPRTHLHLSLACPTYSFAQRNVDVWWTLRMSNSRNICGQTCFLVLLILAWVSSVVQNLICRYHSRKTRSGDKIVAVLIVVASQLSKIYFASVTTRWCSSGTSCQINWEPKNMWKDFLQSTSSQHSTTLPLMLRSSCQDQCSHIRST